MMLSRIIPRNRHVLLFLLTILFFPAGTESFIKADDAGPEDKPPGVEQQYNQAKDYYYLLLRAENMQKDRRNWQKGISEFRRIYLDAPQGRLAPNCLFMMAKMHYRMYMRFHQEVDMDQSIGYYTDVYSLFPHNTLADDAIFWAAEIYLKGKKNPDQAAKLYAKQIEMFPGGDKYSQAAGRLQEIQGNFDIKLSEKYSLSQKNKRLMQVLPVQYWSSDDYTRVVIRSTGPVRYKSFLAEKEVNMPRKLYVDFTMCSVEKQNSGPMAIKEGLLKKIQTTQTDPETVRVALDLESITTYKIFSLNDPFRVIVDVHGQQKIISSSKTLPQVEKEKIARAKRSVPADVEELRPTARKTAKESEAELKTDTAGEPFVVLADRNKKKPRAKGPNAAVDSTLTLAQQLGLGVRRIVLDPGHGGKDPGAMANGLREKDLTLKVARKTAALLKEKYEYEVILTRQKDSSLPLEERTAIANTSKADLFVSIHVNAHPSGRVRGIETFYLNLATNTEAMRVAARENATTTHNISDLQDILSELMQNSKIEESSVLADYVQNSLVSGLQENRYDTENLGVKQAPFYVLIGAEMPAVLAEISFISNKKDASRLREQEYLNEIAAQIAAGVAGYVEQRARAALQL